MNMKKLEDLFINANTPVLEAMAIIDKLASQIVLVIDKDYKLLGTLTDGDIRRGLLQGKSLNSESKNFMNRNYKFITEDEDESKAKIIMKDEFIKQIPVLNSKGYVCKLISLSDEFYKSNLPNSVVIMAGGKGQRLMPLTKICPKPMLKIGGKPMLEIIIQQCIDSGFRSIYLSVNYLKEKVIDYFKDGSHLGVDIKYLEEDKPLGTAGSLSLLPSSINDPILILNGDILTHVNFNKILDFHKDYNASATICARDHDFQCQFGVIKTNGISLESFEEKPIFKQLVNAGIYVIDPLVLGLIKKNQYRDMPDVLAYLKSINKSVIVYPIHEYWLDVGMQESFDKAGRDWSL